MLNQALVVATGVILGFTFIFIPTWIVFETNEPGKFGSALWQFARAEDLTLPLIDYPEKDPPQVTSKEVEALGISFVVASVIYILFKRKTSRTPLPWLPTRSS